MSDEIKVGSKVTTEFDKDEPGEVLAISGNWVWVRIGPIGSGRLHNLAHITLFHDTLTVEIPRALAQNALNWWEHAADDDYRNFAAACKRALDEQ